MTAQLGSDARAANSMAVGTLGALFILRGFAYSVEAPAWTIWINPLGWLTETQPSTGDYWWPLLMAVALAAILLGLAFALQSRRDFGQGAVATRPGPARGSVRSTWRLALRINGGPLIAWAVAFVGLGLVFGRFATSADDILAGNPAVMSILAAGATTPDELRGQLLVTILSMIGIIAAVPGVQTMLKVRSRGDGRPGRAPPRRCRGPTASTTPATSCSPCSSPPSTC